MEVCVVEEELEGNSSSGNRNFSKNQNGGIGVTEVFAVAQAGADRKEDEELKTISSRGSVQDCFSVLPKKVLELIWSQLGNSSSDLWSVCSVSSVWNQKFFDEKTGQIFELVFKYLFQYLEKSDILSCRQVCKRWNSTIDNFLQNHPSLKPYGCEEASSNGPFSPENFPFLYHKNFKGIRLNSLEKVAYFLEEWDQPGVRNPFFERSLGLLEASLDSVSHPKEYWEKAFILLDKFGHHIWFLTVDISSSALNLQRSNLAQELNALYDCLWKVLNRVPNLRILRLGADPPHRDPDTLPFLDMALAVMGFSDRMKDRRLPDVQHLHTIEFESGNVPGPMVGEITKRFSSTLKSLDLNISELKHLDHLSKKHPLQITELLVRLGPDEWDSLLENMSNFMAPSLKKFSLVMMTKKIDMNDLMIVLSMFPEMEYLNLQLHFAMIVRFTLEFPEVDWDIDEDISFPNIKFLEITTDFSIWGLSSLLRVFPNLERILVRTSAEVREKGFDKMMENEMDGILGAGRIENKVIWRNIPTLKEFVLTCHAVEETAQVETEGDSDEDDEDMSEGIEMGCREDIEHEWKKSRKSKTVYFFKRCTRDMFPESTIQPKEAEDTDDAMDGENCEDSNSDSD